MYKAIRSRLIAMNFLEFAVWGAYLTSMGSYLVNINLAEKIGIFYAMQGIVSIFMPALIGIIADKYMQAQRVLSLCHGIAGAAMIAAGYYGMTAETVEFGTLFTLYSISVAFFMPTIALSNSVAYICLEGAGYDTVKAFPPIRVFGTIGFICSMLLVNWMTDANGVQFQMTYNQFFVSGIVGLILMVYALTLPQCPIKKEEKKQSLAEAMGLKAFSLFKNKDMAMVPNTNGKRT